MSWRRSRNSSIPVSILQSCSDLIWPRTCEVCGRAVDRPARHICASCLARLPFVPQVGCCSVCGRAVEGLANDYLCEDCSGAGRPHFDRAASALRFEGVARELVLGFKFRRRLWLRDDLVDWMESALRARFDAAAVDVVLPMPATPWHRLDRGYNQCATWHGPWRGGLTAAMMGASLFARDCRVGRVR